jgi:hypothetical protein
VQILPRVSQGLQIGGTGKQEFDMDRLPWFSNIGGFAGMMAQQSAHPMDKTQSLAIATNRFKRSVP